MITFNIVTRENAVSKLRLAQTTSTGGAAIYPVKMLLRTPDSQLELVPGNYDSTLLTVPPLPAGRYAFELLVGCETVASGTLIVQESVLTPGQACVSGVVYIDLPAVVFYLTPGGQGEKGARGYSAYEIAVQNGYQGTEAEWVDAFNGAQDAVTAAKQSATDAQTAASAAETAKSDAQSAASTAETAKTDAQSAASAAETAKDDAQSAATTAETAKNDAQSAASTAETAKDDAQSAATTADTAKNDAQSAASTAETAKNDAQSAASTAETAKTDAQSAATAAAKSAADAAETLAGAAQVGANNTFAATTTNTFNGALVANGSLLYEQQELGDLLTYSIASRLMEAGINPSSALSETWEDWVSLNPNWESLGTLLFYAPLMQGETIPEFSSISSPFTQCTFISPANVGNRNCQYLLSQRISLYSLKVGICKDVYNCYNVKKCSLYVPKVTTFQNALSAVGFSNGGVELELSVYAPELQNIVLNSVDTTFWRMGLLKSFSIYAPQLVSSFSFSRQTNSGTGQTIAVLQALIAGIGTPGTMQTITTITPSDGTDETIAALRATAETKNWKFILPNGTDL